MTNARHPTDWERQREQLSASLDGELTPAEQGALERHLASCPECRDELDQLRQIRSLLRSLPAPVAPRSFAIPVHAPRTESAESPASRRAASRASRPPWYGATQWLGGIAACAGLFLLLGSAQLSGPATPHYSDVHNGSQAPAAGAVQATRTPLDVRVNPTAGAATVQPAATATTPPTLASPPTGEPGTPLEPIAGAGLLAGGIGLLIAGRLARRER